MRKHFKFRLKNLIRVCSGLSLLLVHHSFTANAQTNQFFIDENLQNYYTGEGDYPFDPKNVEAARSAKESRPANQDPEGNWGIPTEGFQLSVRFEKETYLVGEPIKAVVILRNVSNVPLKYPVSVSDTDTRIVMINSDQKLLPDKRRPDPKTSVQEQLKHLTRGSGGMPMSPVKGQRKFPVDITSNLDLSPGQYTLYATRKILKLNSAEETEIKSGNAMIQVIKTNSETSARPILTNSTPQIQTQTTNSLPSDELKAHDTVPNTNGTAHGPITSQKTTVMITNSAAEPVK